MFTLLITLIFGITLGALLLTILFLYLLKINCPKCKKLKSLQEIFVFTGWKTRTITGQPCQHCQPPKPQVSIEL